MVRQRLNRDRMEIASAADRISFTPSQYRDLCSTCDHSKTCGGRSTAQHPILFCENFEAFVVASPVAKAAAVSRRKSRRQVAGNCKGLCMNCENLQTCKMPRPEGGVWHCEEYR